MGLKKTKKVAQLPLYNRVEKGRDSYVHRALLPDLLPHSVRFWKVAGRIVSVQLRGGGVVKPVDDFHEHYPTEADFLTFMEDCYTRGIVRPSSYSDLFAQRFTSPRVQWTYNSFFSEWFAGGWEDARQTGILPGHWKKYDLNSAYLWSLTQGLPDVDTFRFTRHLERSDEAGTKPGLYLISLDKPYLELPYPFNVARKYVIASSDEIDAYELQPTVVHSGVTYKMLPSVQHMVDLIYDSPCPKLVARSYWGRWISRADVHCHATSTGKHWPIRNPFLNTVWAHSIVSRVKTRIFTQVKNFAHVFVDSVITLADLPTGVGLGDWRLEARYMDGVQVRGPGIYGTPQQLDRHAGQRRG